MTSTTTSLDLDNLIRKSEICSSPRHSSCEHDHKSARGSYFPQIPQQQPPSPIEISTGGDRSNAAHTGTYNSPIPTEVKKLPGKLPIASSLSGGLSSLKRIAPAPGATSAVDSTPRGVERPLQCLETLAAGITFEEKFEISHGQGFRMEKAQSPAQQQQAHQQQAQAAVQHQQQQQHQQHQQQPLQISQEQFQQLQQLQFQHQFGGNMVQVKQEFPQQQASGGQQGNNTIQLSGKSTVALFSKDEH